MIPYKFCLVLLPLIAANNENAIILTNQISKFTLKYDFLMLNFTDFWIIKIRFKNIFKMTSDF